MCNTKVGGTSLTTSPNAPLWHNPQLSEIFKIPDGACWANYGVKYAHQLFRDRTFRSFTDLKTEYKIPNKFFFRYLQLRHAATAQFGREEDVLSPSSMQKWISEKDHSKLFSYYYFTLLTSSSPRVERVAAQLKVDIPSLKEESWSEALESLLPSMIPATDKTHCYSSTTYTKYTIPRHVCIKWVGRNHQNALVAGKQWETSSIWCGSAPWWRNFGRQSWNIWKIPWPKHLFSIQVSSGRLGGRRDN